MTRAPRNRRSGDLTPIATRVAPVLRPLLARRSAAEAALIAQWHEVAGHPWSQVCQPIALQRHRSQGGEEGHLRLACDPGHLLELQHSSTQLIQRINRYLGFPAVHRIRLERREGLRQRAQQDRGKVEVVAAPAEDLDAALARLKATLEGKAR